MIFTRSSKIQHKRSADRPAEMSDATTQEAGSPGVVTSSRTGREEGLTFVNNDMKIGICLMDALEREMLIYFVLKM